MKHFLLILFVMIGFSLSAQATFGSQSPQGEEGSGIVTEADLDVKQVKLYPNPTTDFIQITNDDNVSKVAFYNIIGKRLNTSVHYAGKSHDVSTLQKGIYLVRLFDEDDKVISVFRLNKN